MSAEVVYLDTSALVKLVEHETESDVLREHLDKRPLRASSSLARVELLRAARRRGGPTVARAARLLEELNLIAIDDSILDAAVKVDPVSLRSLDAIHLAAAQALGRGLAEMVTYDQRLAEVATTAGISVRAPA